MIRLAVSEDLPEILEIYKSARHRMKEAGNPTQWGESYPRLELLEQDILEKRLYVLHNEKEIYGVFYFLIGEDDTYLEIQGSFMSDEEYGVIHRIAGKEGYKGIFSECLRFCEEKISHLRIDTHRDNKKMQGVLTKHGFQYRGIIFVEDGSERLAFEKCGGDDLD